MINYYEELGLKPSSSLGEINQELTKQENLWTRRQVTNPEKATQKLSLIMQARRAFSSQTSRMEYDRSLERSKEKPKRVDPQADRNEQFQKWRDQTRTYLETNQYDLAKSSAEKALSFYDSNNDNDQFLSLVAEVYLKNGNQQFALDYINKAIILKSDNPNYFIIKASIQRELANKSYNAQEEEKYLQDARNTLLMAIKVAQNINDKKMESAAYGLLAYYYYFVPSPNRDKAEMYAKRSIDLGGVYGNARKVINDINRVREQEQRHAEAERKRQSELKLQKEREEKERKERLAKQEAEGKLLREKEAKKKHKEKTAKTIRTISTIISIILYIIVWVVHFTQTAKMTVINGHVTGYIDINTITILLSFAIAIYTFGVCSFPKECLYSIIPVVIVLIIHGLAMLIYNPLYSSSVSVFPRIIILVVVYVITLLVGYFFWKAYHREKM